MFSNIIGHKKEIEKLESMIKQGFSGSYLFYGPMSTGKRTIAFEVTKILLCEKGDPDGCSCRSCKKFGSEHPDFLFIGGEKIKVVDVDKVLDFFSVAPLISSQKVVVIDNSHNITWEASNRLLKILEEPPEGFLLILISSNPEKLLPTILYRCIKIEFESLEQRHMITILTKKLGFEINQALALVNMSSYCLMDIFSCAGQYLCQRELALEFVNSMKSKPLIFILDFIDKIDKDSLSIFSDMIILILTDILLLQEGFNDLTNKDLEKNLLKCAEKYNLKALIGIVNIFSQVKKNAHLNINMNLVLKSTIMKSHPYIMNL